MIGFGVRVEGDVIGFGVRVEGAVIAIFLCPIYVSAMMVCVETST